jgi:diguanylate cyclase (GGDEF)-like protein
VSVSIDEQTRLGILESVMRSVKVGAMVLDSEQRLVLWNHWVEQHIGQLALKVGDAFADVFPDMVNGRTHAAIREGLSNNFPSLISQTLNKSPFPFYGTAADAANDHRIQQAVQVIPFEVDGMARHCLIQITDVSKVVLREKLLRDQSVILKAMSYTDGLTGIANRRHFDERIEEELARARRSKTPLSLLLVDIDFFKPYNDLYGHVQGDQCLREVAVTLQSSLHRPADLAARYGGEEFAIILPDTPLEGAHHLAETTRAAVEARRFSHEGSVVAAHVTVSIGLATCLPDDTLGVQQLIELADAGLYEAKKAGRNRTAVARMQPEMLS